MSSQPDSRADGNQSVEAREYAAAKAMLRAERRRHRAMVQELQAEVSDLQAKLKESSTSLELANQKLAATLPQQHVSDAVIRLTYQDLCESIEDWISTNCHNISDVAKIIRKNDSTFKDSKLTSTLLDGNTVHKVAKSYPLCGEEIVAKIFMRFLYETLLRRSCWVLGKLPYEEKMLTQVLDHLYNVYPERGPEFRENWRCDTYKALSAYYQDHPSPNNLSDIFHQYMSNFADKNAVFNGKRLSEIINEANALADKVKRCPVHYCFIYPIAPRMSAEQKDMNKKSMEWFDLVDAETGEIVRKNDIEADGDKTISGEVLCIIFPCLAKILADGTVVKIAKGTALIKKHALEIPHEAVDNDTAAGEETKTKNHEEKKRQKLIPAPTPPAMPAVTKSWAEIVRG